MNEQKISARPLEEKAEIESAQNLSEDARAVVELDQDTQGRLSRMDAMERQAMAQAVHTRRAQRLTQINAALERMETGEYGYCLDCAEAIAPERLDAEPCVLKCHDCAKG